MQFKTLDEVLAHRFAGNHASDNEAFIAIQVFISERMTEVVKAANHMAVAGMGFEPGLPEEMVFNGFGEQLEI